MSRAQGGYPSFFRIRRLEPASTVHPQKDQEFQAPQKSIPILYLDLKKDPKMHRNYP